MFRTPLFDVRALRGLTEVNPQAFVVNNDDRAPDSVLTTNSMDVGDRFFGTLDFDRDWDWIEIEIDGPQTVLFTLDGRTRFELESPLIQLRNSEGATLDENDDGLYSNSTALEYSFYGAGTYYIIVDSVDFSDGRYVLEAQNIAPTPVPDFDVLATVDWGTQLDSATVNVFFAPSGYAVEDPFYGSIDGDAWNTYEQEQFQEAFDLISSVSDLSFNIVTSEAAAELVLVMDTNDIEGQALGFFNPPGGPTEGIGVFSGADWDRFPGGDLEQGGNGFVTVVHELLHGLGLAHPHDDGNGGSAVLPNVEYTTGQLGAYILNQGVYTTMTYNNGFYDGPVGTMPDVNLRWGFEAGPMALDIAVLQEKYGANTTHHSGNNVYSLPTTNISGTLWSSIWDTGGVDTIRSGVTRREVTIDLRAATLQAEHGGGGYLSATEETAGGFTIAHGVEIENAEGSFGDDTLIGNELDNTFKGGSGDDTITGFGGNDTVYGDNGDDDVRGGAGDDDIHGGGGNDFLRGGNGTDHLFGGGGDDILSGQRFADEITAGEGDDRVFGGGGNDVIYGNEGNDFLRGGSRKDDIYGGNGNDFLAGNNFDDMLFGGNGNDRLFSGGQNDTLDGGAGFDFLKGGTGNDTFIFNNGHDVAIIADFRIGEDRLVLDAGLLNGLTDIELVVENYSDITSEGVIFDFGNAQTVTLAGLNTLDGLSTAMEIA